jgi:hypothetical protein
MGNALAAVDLGSGRTAVSVSAGKSNTCAVLVREINPSLLVVVVVLVLVLVLVLVVVVVLVVWPA